MVTLWSMVSGIMDGKLTVRYNDSEGACSISYGYTRFMDAGNNTVCASNPKSLVSLANGCQFAIAGSEGYNKKRLL